MHNYMASLVTRKYKQIFHFCHEVRTRSPGGVSPVRRPSNILPQRNVEGAQVVLDFILENCVSEFLFLSLLDPLVMWKRKGFTLTEFHYLEQIVDFEPFERCQRRHLGGLRVYPRNGPESFRFDLLFISKHSICWLSSFRMCFWNMLLIVLDE